MAATKQFAVEVKVRFSVASCLQSKETIPTVSKAVFAVVFDKATEKPIHPYHKLGANGLA